MDYRSMSVSQLAAGVYLIKVSEGDFGVPYSLRVGTAQTYIFLPAVRSSTP